MYELSELRPFIDPAVYTYLGTSVPGVEGATWFSLIQPIANRVVTDRTNYTETTLETADARTSILEPYATIVQFYCRHQVSGRSYEWLQEQRKNYEVAMAELARQAIAPTVGDDGEYDEFVHSGTIRGTQGW